MKKHTLYLLIGAMVLALAGIISLQYLWIDNAIQTQEKEYKQLVHQALNHVDDAVRQQEGLLFIKEEFGDLDTLIENIIGIRDTHFVRRLDTFFVQDRDTINYKEVHRFDASQADVQIVIQNGEEETEDRIIWKEDNTFSTEKFKTIHAMIDKAVMEKSMLAESFSFEHDSPLRIRLHNLNLDSIIRSALAINGVLDSFSYAVFNNASQDVEQDFSTPNFERFDAESHFERDLFTHDVFSHFPYLLKLKLAGNNSFIWRKVQLMVWGSLLFTFLILACFFTAVYYILKQKKISRIKNDFISNMTHEFKTPLASISLAADSILHPNNLNDTSKVTGLINLIKEEKDRLNAQVERVLEMSLLDNKQLQLSKSSISLKDIMLKAIAKMELHLNSKGGKLEQNATGEHFNVIGDPLHLENVIVNLLDNAIKYSPEIPQVSISLQEEPQHLLLTVEDHGQGMSKEALRHVFDPFFREQSGNIHNVKGFGLGLNYVQQIVHLHEGTVQIKSKKGTGTTVLVKLNKHGA